MQLPVCVRLPVPARQTGTRTGRGEKEGFIIKRKRKEDNIRGHEKIFLI